MKKITKGMLSCLCGIATVFSVNASVTELSETILNGNNESNFSTILLETEPCYASSVVEFAQGLRNNGTPIPANRSNPELALGEPDRSNAPGGFVSLGVNGYIILGFSGVIYDAPGVDILVYETSFSGNNCGLSDDESALIELSQDGVNWVTYGEICRNGQIDFAGLGLDYVAYIKVTNLTTTTPDGYDLDGVEAVNGCQAPPTPCYGSSVISYEPSFSKGPIAPSRLDPTKGLGQPQGGNTNNFVSLGFGGQITIGFDGVVYNEPGDDLTIVEITHGNKTFATYPESADVYVTQNGVDFYLIGTVYTKESASFDIDAAPVHLDYITQVRLIDTTPNNSVSDDGFDLDGIIAINGCSEAPEVEVGECFAADYLEYIQGTTRNGGVLPAVRTNPLKALGEPEGTDTNVFTTLGYGGSITLAFNGAIINGPGPDIQFIETSFGQTNGCSNYPEFADIYVSYDNNSWHYAGTVCKENNTIDISDAGNFDHIYYVKAVNNNELSTTPDGYDLDGVIALYNCPTIQIANLGIQQAEAKLNVGLYPNPSNGPVKISFVAPESNIAVVEIYDLFGRTISTAFNKEINTGQQYDIDFDGSNLPTGVYVYKLTIGNTTIANKFVISR